MSIPSSSPGESTLIERFLSGDQFAVAGASSDRDKYGNRVFRALRESGRDVFALNPRTDEVEGSPAYASLAEVPRPVDRLSIVTPPKVTRQIIAEAIASGVRMVWMQPGAEDSEAIEQARTAGLDVIEGGPCVLVSLRFDSRGAGGA